MELTKAITIHGDYCTNKDCADSPPEERMSSFSHVRSADDDAIFKERLRNMGKMSRKKFSQLARVFTGRKKRSSSAKAILQEEDSDGP